MTKTTHNIQRFVTEALYLAAYLICCENIEFKGTESSKHEETKQFVFEGEDKHIDELLLDYYNRKARVEPQRYIEEIGRLRDLLKIKGSKCEINCQITVKKS